MLVGGSIAAPISAWLVRHFDDRALGTAVGGLIILINLDRVLLLLGFDAGFVTSVRLVVIALSVVIILALVSRGSRQTRGNRVGAAVDSRRRHRRRSQSQQSAPSRPDLSVPRAPHLPSRRLAGAGLFSLP